MSGINGIGGGGAVGVVGRLEGALFAGGGFAVIELHVDVPGVLRFVDDGVGSGRVAGINP